MTKRLRLIPPQPLTKVIRLVEAFWLTPEGISSSGDLSTWMFSLPTRIEGFEAEGNLAGLLQSIKIAEEEQLISGLAPFPLMQLFQYYPANTIPSSPSPGFKTPALTLRSAQVGQRLQILTLGFSGRIKPFGCQVEPI